MFDTLYPIVSRCSLANEIERDVRWGGGGGGLLERERERGRLGERERGRLFMAKLDTKYYLTHHIHCTCISHTLDSKSVQ